MIVPLLAHGRTLGALSFVAAESGRRYGAGDLRVAEDIAWRAALAVDNARAFQEAQRANRVKDSFLATLSHELRTPLNAILGYARMLRSGMLDGEKQARALEIVERSGASLAQIVEDVLDVSRIVTGKLRLNIQPVEVPVVVTDGRHVVGRRRSAATGGVEPRVERGEVHAARRARRGARRPRRQRCADRRQRYRARVRVGLRAAPVRSVQPGRQRLLSRTRRARPRSGDCAAPRRSARRNHSSQERRHRQGRYVHRRAACSSRRIGGRRAADARPAGSVRHCRRRP